MKNFWCALITSTGVIFSFELGAVESSKNLGLPAVALEFAARVKQIPNEPAEDFLSATRMLLAEFRRGRGLDLVQAERALRYEGLDLYLIAAPSDTPGTACETSVSSVEPVAPNFMVQLWVGGSKRIQKHRQSLGIESAEDNLRNLRLASVIHPPEPSEPARQLSVTF